MASDKTTDRPHVMMAREIARLLDVHVTPHTEGILGREIALNVVAAQIVCLVDELQNGRKEGQRSFIRPEVASHD